MSTEMGATDVRNEVREILLREAEHPTVALKELENWTDEFLMEHWESVHDAVAIASLIEEVA